MFLVLFFIFFFNLSSLSFAFVLSLPWTSETGCLERGPKELDERYFYPGPKTIKIKTRIRMPSTGVESSKTLINPQ